MAQALVQQTSIGSGGSPVSKAYATNPTANNLLIAISVLFSGTGTVSGISDTIGNTWNTWTGLPFQSATGLATLAAYYAFNTTTAADTVTITSSNSTLELYIAEFSGVSTSAVADGAAGTADGASGATVTTPSITTTGGDDLLLSAFAGGYSSFGGSTPTWVQGGTDGSGEAWGYALDQTAGTYNQDINQSSGAFASIVVALGVLTQPDLNVYRIN